LLQSLRSLGTGSYPWRGADDRYIRRSRASEWSLHRGQQRTAHGPVARLTPGEAHDNRLCPSY
jgi:hypothetical protein